jgi:hypothetical protein
MKVGNVTKIESQRVQRGKATSERGRFQAALPRHSANHEAGGFGANGRNTKGSWV